MSFHQIIEKKTMFNLRSKHSVSVQWVCPCRSCKWIEWKIPLNILSVVFLSFTQIDKKYFLFTSARSRRMANSWLQKHAHSSISSPIFFKLFLIQRCQACNGLSPKKRVVILSNTKNARSNLCLGRAVLHFNSNLDDSNARNNCFVLIFDHNWNKNKEWMTIFLSRHNSFLSIF